MREYIKPVVLANEELAEGVYAASGDCYSVSTSIHQSPEVGRVKYTIQVNAVHAAADGHHGGAQVLTLSFNMPVTYQWSSGALQSGDGTSTLKISYAYHSNAEETIGMGNIEVIADAGLAVTNAVLSCDHTCSMGHPIN